MNALDEARSFARYVRGLREYLRTPLASAIAQRLAARDASMSRIVERGVFGQPDSVYHQLLRHAGFALPDVQHLIAEGGAEAALNTLYDAGVRISLDEFKGRTSVVRGSLNIATTAASFDNPLLTSHYEAQTGGSRGAGRRIRIDFDLLNHEAAYFERFVHAFGLHGRDVVLWRPVPLVSTGITSLLRYHKIGQRVVKWFSPTRSSGWKYSVFTQFTVRTGHDFPQPEYAPLEDAERIARYLVGKRVIVDTNTSSGVRICLAAQRAGLDISGTFFRFGAEPYTEAKARVVADSGCRAACHYSISEIGNVGMACANPIAVDEVHLLDDKLGAIQRPIAVGDRTVSAMVYTTLLPSCPKLMINVESDDYAELSSRDCGCAFGALGLGRHLHTIRSYEKLCSEGVSFLGTELLRLIEDVLPATYGGTLADYQFVEHEEHGLSKVSILISPRLGEIAPTEVVDTIFSVLRRVPGGEVMSTAWQRGNTLRIERRDPYVTGSAKVLPLHLARRS